MDDSDCQNMEILIVSLHYIIAQLRYIVCYRAILTSWYSGTTVIDLGGFGDSLQARDFGLIALFGPRARRNLDILAPAWLLSCHLGTSLTT